MVHRREDRDACFAHFGRYGSDTGGTFQAELRHLLEDDDGRVVGSHRNTGERNGKRLDVIPRRACFSRAV
jgi:uncharacterized protein